MFALNGQLSHSTTRSNLGRLSYLGQQLTQEQQLQLQDYVVRVMNHTGKHAQNIIDWRGRFNRVRDLESEYTDRFADIVKKSIPRTSMTILDKELSNFLSETKNTLNQEMEPLYQILQVSFNEIYKSLEDGLAILASTYQDFVNFHQAKVLTAHDLVKNRFLPAVQPHLVPLALRFHNPTYAASPYEWIKRMMFGSLLFVPGKLEVRYRDPLIAARGKELIKQSINIPEIAKTLNISESELREQLQRVGLAGGVTIIVLIASVIVAFAGGLATYHFFFKPNVDHVADVGQTALLNMYNALNESLGTVELLLGQFMTEYEKETDPQKKALLMEQWKKKLTDIFPRLRETLQIIFEENKKKIEKAREEGRGVDWEKMAAYAAGFIVALIGLKVAKVI